MRFTAVAAIVVCAVNASLVVAADSRGRAATATSRPVTVTGCLEQQADAFRLTDTGGAHAPTARSWKSGFMRKRPSNLTVVEGATRLKLRNHVGHRVSITGAIEGRGISARSMRHIAASCGR